MCNGGYCTHRFSVKDIVACSSKLQFVFWDREIMGTCLCLVLSNVGTCVSQYYMSPAKGVTLYYMYLSTIRYVGVSDWQTWKVHVK
jgi:hypothetical protein